MKTYDVKCPICGHVNHNLFLEETDGWMECEKCRSMARSENFGEMIRLPIVKLKPYSEYKAAHA
ncbi:translation initiation factor 2 [Fusibacillus kribbianus]|uniref:Translation initiation factor 2 n=1 Tax=Fusibacillus kribbianus TaxID=3044208 RepID=A0AAP4BDB1_9FIRM|nr:translation initiation factor 2 [Ruminococcus sp. YH-rum2234]MDI9243203.1 translation initiation factor 2 [Ruminococcus sp. YH-rum2234]